MLPCPPNCIFLYPSPPFCGFKRWRNPIRAKCDQIIRQNGAILIVQPGPSVTPLRWRQPSFFFFFTHAVLWLFHRAFGPKYLIWCWKSQALYTRSVKPQQFGLSGALGGGHAQVIRTGGKSRPHCWGKSGELWGQRQTRLLLRREGVGV